MSIGFEAWPKIPRMNKAGSMTITEKLDGTNAAVVIQQFVVPENGDEYVTHDPQAKRIMFGDDCGYLVGAQSRKRLITPENDNAGFARWVWQHAENLVAHLGPGRHFGEWWGQGIQRRYGMDRKVFSLFNTHRWSAQEDEFRSLDIGLDVVPLLYIGAFRNDAIERVLDLLRLDSSPAARPYGVEFDRPEGVVIWHHELRGNLKAFVENDDTPKGLQDNG